MNFKEIIFVAGYTIEAVGVLVIIFGCVAASLRFLSSYRRQAEGVAYRAYRRQPGRSIIPGVGFLVAGAIIRTVVVADTLANVAVLGLIILIRSFLSVTLFLEVEGAGPGNSPESSKVRRPMPPEAFSARGRAAAHRTGGLGGRWLPAAAATRPHGAARLAARA